MWGELAHSIQQLNVYILLMFGLGTIASAIIIQRWIMLRLVYSIDFKKFLNNLKKMIAAEDVDRAISWCKSESTTGLPRIALRALEAAETDPTTVKGTIEEETIDFLPNLEMLLSALPAFTMLIMFVGITGTIDTLWSAFHSVDVLDTAKKQAALAQGIAAALNPTFMGLLFGMVILAAYYLLKGTAIKLVERVHYGVAVLNNLLVPQEMATYVPVSAGVAPAAVSTAAAEAPADKASDEFVTSEDEGGSSDDSFDDVSVEDIKDEEEII